MSERIYQVIIGVLVLVVIIGGWMMIASKHSTSSTMGTDATSTMTDSDTDTADMDTDTSDTSTGTESSMHSQTAAGEDVEASDQKAGMAVMVDSVTLKATGWVAVEGSNEWILGAARLQAGTQTDVTVPLLRGTVAGETYKVILFADDGDGAFDLHKDTVIKNSDGSTMSAAFIAQ